MNDRVRFLVLPSEPSVHTIGTHAGLRSWIAWVLAILGALGSVLFYLVYARRLAWYEHFKVTHWGKGPRVFQERDVPR